ncbi:hypothetical protein, partial [Copranaerobaculum intestinale]|uniref:hypothetical protein n=1 Tax=Copranaerobaculum intestinale TaxID=2692629 RepID=UPI00201C180F
MKQNVKKVNFLVDTGVSACYYIQALKRGRRSLKTKQNTSIQKKLKKTETRKRKEELNKQS